MNKTLYQSLTVRVAEAELRDLLKVPKEYSLEDSGQSEGTDEHYFTFTHEKEVKA